MPDKIEHLLWPHRHSTSDKFTFFQPLVFFSLLNYDRLLSRDAAHFIVCLVPKPLLGLFAWLILRRKGTGTLTQKNTKRDNTVSTVSLMYIFLRNSCIKVVQTSFVVMIWIKVNKTGLQSIWVRVCARARVWINSLLWRKRSEYEL